MNLDTAVESEKGSWLDQVTKIPHLGFARAWPEGPSLLFVVIQNHAKKFNKKHPMGLTVPVFARIERHQKTMRSRRMEHTSP